MPLLRWRHHGAGQASYDAGRRGHPPHQFKLSIDNYIRQAGLTTVAEPDALVKKLVGSAEDLGAKGKVSKRYLEVVRKSRNMDAIISVDTLNKYVHSSSLAPASDHLTAIWDTFAELIVHCLNE